MPFWGCATIAGVCRCAVLLAILVLAAPPLNAQDPLGEARRLYNAGRFDDAEQSARAAVAIPATANAARVVLGRIQLERHRKTPSSTALADARAAFREVDPRPLDPRERIELTLGLAEILFLEDRFAAAAEMFGPILASSETLGSAAHERVLDWWATALDRHAQTRPMTERPPVYARILERMHAELARDVGSVPAGYWVVAAARATGDLDTAWSAATAAWVRASLGRDRGVILRGDLDRLVVQALIPERAARLSPKDPSVAVAGLLSEWEAFKAQWTR